MNNHEQVLICVTPWFTAGASRRPTCEARGQRIGDDARKVGGPKPN
jgi:hypothetical protein